MKKFQNALKYEELIKLIENLTIEKKVNVITVER